MQTKIIGGGTVNPGVELGVDPTFLAARVSLRPLDYAQFGQILGHYRVSFSTAAIAPAANAVLASFRWGDLSRFCVLTRIIIGTTVATAVTPQRTDPIVCTIQRGYSINETTNATAVTLLANANKMRTVMGSSLVSQLTFASAAAGISGGTRSADTNAFAQVQLAGLGAIGTGDADSDAYSWGTQGSHPPVFASNEGLLVLWGPTALATGTVTVNITLEWAEVIVF